MINTGKSNKKTKSFEKTLEYTGKQGHLAGRNRSFRI